VTQGTVLTLQAVVDAGGAVTAGAVTLSDGTRVLASVQLVSTGSSFTHGTANLKLFWDPEVTCSRPCMAAPTLM
jgi:hypothetical protein